MGNTQPVAFIVKIRAPAPRLARCTYIVNIVCVFVNIVLFADDISLIFRVNHTNAYLPISLSSQLYAPDVMHIIEKKINFLTFFIKMTEYVVAVVRQRRARVHRNARWVQGAPPALRTPHDTKVLPGRPHIPRAHRLHHRHYGRGVYHAACYKVSASSIFLSLMIRTLTVFYFFPFCILFYELCRIFLFFIGI